ncbi:MAG: hypothetical protein V9H26_20075 [Verrucomicrobiota bacterium]
MSVKCQKMMWAMGCALLLCVLSFWGIVYFDQSVIGWYVLLALFASASEIKLDLSLNKEVRFDLGVSIFGTDCLTECELHAIKRVCSVSTMG